MPPSASPDIAPPAGAPHWIAHSLRKLIGKGAEGPSGSDWASSPKGRQKSRRPVWE